MAAAMNYLLNPETWQQQWAAFRSAPLIMTPAFVVVALGVWWFRWTTLKGEIRGLREQNSALRERISVVEERLRLATEQTAAADRARDEAEKDSRNLKTAIADKADNASLAALYLKLDTAIGQWAAANNEVRSTLSGALEATEAPDRASFTIDTTRL
jgi:hypothetical protein